MSRPTKRTPRLNGCLEETGYEHTTLTNEAFTLLKECMKQVRFLREASTSLLLTEKATKLFESTWRA